MSEGGVFDVFLSSVLSVSKRLKRLITEQGVQDIEIIVTHF